jgi:hypothetical protein
LFLSPGDKKRVDLVLSPAGSLKPESSASQPAAKPSPGAMEFKDEANFTVAGVTDWSNLGLHGSAANSGTSESLARETLTLKSGEPEKARRNASEEQHSLTGTKATSRELASKSEKHWPVQMTPKAIVCWANLTSD